MALPCLWCSFSIERCVFLGHIFLALFWRDWIAICCEHRCFLPLSVRCYELSFIKLILRLNNNHSSSHSRFYLDITCCNAVLVVFHALHISLAHCVIRLSTSPRRRWDEDLAPARCEIVNCNEIRALSFNFICLDQKW